MANSNAGTATLLIQSHYKMMDWKNGKGRTAEIAIFPGHASFPADPFLWRLSSAQITQDGEFSKFPGYDRYLVLVKGTGGKLYFGENQRKVLLHPGEVHRFSGDEPVSCELTSGAIQDLNLIIRQNQVKAKFETIRLSKKPRSFRMEGKLVFIFGLSGPIAAEVFPGEAKFTLQQGDALRIEVPEGDIPFNQLLLLDPGSQDCLVTIIELDI